MFICLCLLCLFLHIIMLPFWNMFSIIYFTMLFFYLFFIIYDSDYFTWNFNITGNKRSRFHFSLRHASVNWNSIISKAFHHNESHCSFMKSKIYIFQTQEVHQIITCQNGTLFKLFSDIFLPFFWMCAFLYQHYNYTCSWRHTINVNANILFANW